MDGIRVEGIDKLRQMAEIELPKRVMAMCRFVLREVVEKVHEAIVKAIPENERWLKEYKKALQIYEIKPRDLGEDEIGFVIGAKMSGDWSMVEADKMIVNFKAETLDPYSEVGGVLQKHSPFTVDMVPALANYGSDSSVRRVRSDEIQAVRSKNRVDLAALNQELIKAKAQFRQGPANVEGTIYFDMAFMVMRMEKKWGDIKKPHWRPALRKVGANISSVYRDPKLKKIVSGLFDEHNVTWKKEDANKFDTIRLHDLEEFKEFQEKIWK
jgi:hypothetical protein